MNHQPTTTIQRFILLALAISGMSVVAAPEAPEALQLVKLDMMVLHFATDTARRDDKGRIQLDPSDQFKFRHQVVKDGKMVRGDSELITVGQNIFAEGPFKDRFSVAKVQVRNDNLVATIEDRKPRGRRTTFELQKGARHATVIRICTLTLRGERKKQFEVREGERFSLPSGRVDPNGPYTFTSVDENGSVVIEYKDNKIDAKSKRVVVGPAKE